MYTSSANNHSFIAAITFFSPQMHCARSSPWMHHSSCMFFGIIVTRFSWSVHSLALLKRQTRYASKASWRARRAVLCIRKSNFNVTSNHADKMLEGFLPQQKVCVLLVFTDLTKGNGPRVPRIGFLHAPNVFALLLCSICCKLNAWGLSPSLPACGLFCSGDCPIVDDVIFLCSCVCVSWFEFFSFEKKGESVMTQNFNNENLNHPFTGTSLHRVASKSMPERIEVSHQSGIHSVLTSSHGRVLTFSHFFFRSNFVILSHDPLLALCVAAMSPCNHIPHPPNTQQPT